MVTVAKDSHLAALRECQDRQLDREGIPMFLVMVDERPGRRLPAPPAADPDGADVAARVGELRSGLAPSQREDDLGVVVSLLQTAAYVDVTLRALP